MRGGLVAIVVVLAGCGENPPPSSPFRAELVSGAWSQLSPPTPLPVPRDWHALAIDDRTNSAILFGGLNSAGTALGDTWLFDGTFWSNPSNTGPGARSKMAAVFQSNLPTPSIVLTGGNDASNVLLHDTWRWMNNGWTLASPTSPVPSRIQAAIAYDPDDLETVLFGGTADGGMTGLADTWLWNDAASTWSRVSPTGTPLGRMNARMVWDPVRHKVLLFGGFTGSTRLNDLWQLDVPTLTWTQVVPAASPVARSGPGFVWDTVRNVAVLFGGFAGGTTNLGDTWEWDGTQWTQTAASGPAARSVVTTVFMTNGAAGRTMLFGGAGATGVLGDTWVYVGNGGACATNKDCDNSHCVDGVCCQQASCGTCQTCNGATPGQCAAVFNAEDADSCAVTSYCDAAAACQPKHAAGGSCSVAIGCLTGFCADSTCCTSACNGTCDTCANSTGTCTIVANGDTPDCTGTKTCDATSQCLLKTGQSCSTAGSCASGFCADGYCCNNACSGACDVCSATPGTCTLVAKGGTGAPSCAPYVCDGVSNACPSSCANDTGCDKNDYCSGSSCAPKAPNGTVCSANDQCTSGYCVDGTCCSTACNNICQTCATANGACVLVKNADDNTCTGTTTCDANGVCKDKNGRGCSFASTCASGFCVDGNCCENACSGTCQTCGNSTGTCAPIINADDAGCAGTKTCGPTGVCSLKNGQPCTMASQCASNFCVGGICCSTACTGACSACDATPGTCTPLAAGTAGSPSCAPYVCTGSTLGCPGACTADSGCAAGFYCTNNGLCAPQRTLGQSCSGSCAQSGCRECGSGFCVDGVCCNAACTGQCQVCSAALGAPVDGMCSNAPLGATGSPSCAPYSCPGTTTSCSTFCTGDLNCAAGYYCAPAVGCVPQRPNGANCNTAAGADCVQAGCRECATGACAAGICNGSTLPNGAACSANAACTSGFCVDGVCCNSACSGACTVCNASGSVGTCSNAPTGSNPRGLCPGSGPCKASCGGAGVCVYPGPSTACAPAGCTSATTLHLTSTCDGSGTCADRGTADCTPFACAGGACYTSCIDPSQCAAPNLCSGGSCGVRRADGQPCAAAGDCASGFCTDGVCCSSACGGKCARCDLPGPGGQIDGLCRAPVGQDPDGDCTGQGLCAGVCTAASTCQFPGADRTCDLCKACDGAGGCTRLPASGDDPACMTIACSQLSTECAHYQDLTSMRCASPGTCVAPNDPAHCTSRQAAPDGTTCAQGSCVSGVCTPPGAGSDGGNPPGSDGGSAPGSDGGSAPGSDAGPQHGGSSGCAVGGPAPSGVWMLLGLLFLRRRRRRA
jgi:hypothetical protein